MMRVINVTMSVVMMVLALMVGHLSGSHGSAVAERERASVSVFNVGGTAGWTLPTPANNINYTTWANSHTFVIGDILYFNYDRDYNNVMMVSRLDYERCNSTKPLVTYDDGASNFTLNRAGTFYFLSGISSHCRSGQRLAVHVRKHPLRSSQPTNSSISPSPANDNTNTNIPPPSYEDANDAPHLVETNITFMTMSISLLLISMLTFMSV